MFLNSKSFSTLVRALRIFCTCEAAIRTHLRHICTIWTYTLRHGPCTWGECDADLFPVRGDDAYLTRCNGSMAFLSTWFQQFPYVAHQHLHLCHIKERGTALLTLVDTSHTVKDQREVLRGRAKAKKWLSCLVVWLPRASTDFLSVPNVQILIGLPIEIEVFF